MISTVIQTYDFVHVRQIDATAFFEQASDSDIRELLRYETDHYSKVWHGRKKAYGGKPQFTPIVVRFFDFMLERDKTFQLIEKHGQETGISGVIYFLASDLENWLKETRPHLYAETV